MYIALGTTTVLIFSIFFHVYQMVKSKQKRKEEEEDGKIGGY